MEGSSEGPRAPLIDGFADLRVIGRGGFSTVYSAVQTDLHRQVAIKVFTDGEESPQRLERELKALGALADVPHIVSPHAVLTTDDGHAAIVMPLFRESLAQRVRLLGPQPPEQVCIWASQLATCLDRTHGRGVVHRDIKPENLLLDDAGDIHLTDFGIAGMDALASRTATVMSISPPHAAPERLRGDEQHPIPGDIYSLASTLYFALAGRAPFGTTSDGGPLGLIGRIANDPLPPDSLVPSGVLDVLQRGMAKEPSDRFVSAREFADALEAAQRAAPAPTSPTEGRSDLDDRTIRRSDLFTDAAAPAPVELIELLPGTGPAEIPSGGTGAAGTAGDAAGVHLPELEQRVEPVQVVDGPIDDGESQRRRAAVVHDPVVDDSSSRAVPVPPTIQAEVEPSGATPGGSSHRGVQVLVGVALAVVLVVGGVALVAMRGPDHDATASRSSAKQATDATISEQQAALNLLEEISNERRETAEAIEATGQPLDESGAAFSALFHDDQSATTGEINTVVYRDILPSLDAAIASLDAMSPSDEQSVAALAARRNCLDLSRARFVREGLDDEALPQAQRDAERQLARDAAQAACDESRDRLRVLREKA